MTAVRTPAVAGQFYEGTEAGLRTQIESVFQHDLGPGALQAIGEGDPDTGLASLVSPHAGYPYSGPVAAHGFGALAETGEPSVVVIIGPNHSGFGDAIALTEAERWQTPLGTVPVDRELSEQILEASSTATADERTHAGEHSIEVQVPFLQYLFEDVAIVPIAMTRQEEATATAFAETLHSVLEGYDGYAVVVASTDLTHYEPQSIAEQKDRQAIDRMVDLDVPGLYETIAAENISMCGYGPTAVALHVAAESGATGGDLLQYATSGDTTGSTSEVVGYASVAVR